MSQPAKIAILKSIPFWTVLGVGILLVFPTILYHWGPVHPAFLRPIFWIGYFGGYLYIFSIIISIATLFKWREYQYFYLPLIINILVFLFLYICWYSGLPPTYNDKAADFYYTSKLVLPKSVINYRSYDDHGGFFGDGISETTFYLQPEEMRAFLSNKNYKWDKGPYKEVGTVLNTQTFDNTLNLLDSDHNFYHFIDRSPQGSDYVANYSVIVVDPIEDWVLAIDSDS